MRYLNKYNIYKGDFLLESLNESIDVGSFTSKIKNYLSNLNKNQIKEYYKKFIEKVSKLPKTTKKAILIGVIPIFALNLSSADLEQSSDPVVIEVVSEVETLEVQEPVEEIVEDNNTQYFVAEIDNKIVGFAGLCWYTIPSKGLMAWVEELIVDEKIRGKGIGKSLMNELINLAHEIKCNKMELTVNNPIAISLYEKLGFEFTNSKVMIKKHY